MIYSVYRVVLILNPQFDFYKLGTEVRKFVEGNKYRVNYTCMNYSQDFTEYMNSRGYRTEIVCGYNNDNEPGHCWNRIIIDVEPQTGRIVDYIDKYNYIIINRWGETQ